MIQPTIEPGDLNRYPCGCWLRACSADHDHSPSEMDRLRKIQEITEFHAIRFLEDRNRLRELYGDMLNQFAIRGMKNGQQVVMTGGLSDLEVAFVYFKLPDPCSLDQFHAALTEPRP